MTRSLLSFSLCAFSLGVLAIAAGNLQAGCGLLHRGGCSDPCAAAACGGYGATSCAGCSAVQASGCSACGAPAGSVSSGCAACGTGGQAAINGGCAACAMAQTAPQGMAARTVVPTQQTELIDCGPVTSYQVVMEPKYFTETKAQCVTEYQDEIRYRTRTVARQVAVQVEDYRTTTVMVPKTETKTVEYSVLVPQKNEKTVEVVETVPVWNEITDTYTVKVPTVIDVPEQYMVRVAQLRDEAFTYTVYVPTAQTETKMQTVTNAVPVTKSRLVQVCRPVTTMQTVTRDYGHWEVRVEEIAAAQSVNCSAGASAGISLGGCGSYSGNCGGCGGCGQVYSRTRGGCLARSTCGSCGGCGVQTSCSGCGSSACGGGCASAASTNCGGCGSSNCAGGGSCGSVTSTGSQTVSRRVWVPNVVTEQVPVVQNVSETQEVTYTAFEQQTEQIPYECTYMVYAPEERTGSRKVVDYVEEARTRTRKVVEYKDETRTRTRKELSYKQETRTETIPYVTYTTEKQTKEVSYTVSVPETKVEPITTTRYDTVQEEITEEYSVRVPVITSKEVQVQVCRMVPKLVPVTIYPCQSTSGAMSSAGGCTNCASPTPAPPSVTGSCATCGASGCTTCPR